MLRSMYAGISGMKVNQTKLDVIGNNISNVNTTAFKASRARFSDMLNQNVSNAMAPSNNQGGINSSQVGLGVQLASIDSVMTQGNIQPTGRQLDVAIDGDGFFMVSKGQSMYGNTLEVTHSTGSHNITEQSLTNSGIEMMYTRDGSFTLDEQGNLLTGDGYRILGYSLTNDDSSQEATGLSPSTIGTAGLNFRFGPGSQLNDFKVVIGAIGPGTVTSAEVKKEDKTIILNGDFSTSGTLTTGQIESAISKGLSSAGISQSVYVTGNPSKYEGLGSATVSGGTDATAPKSVSILGFRINLSEGDELNEYTFEVGSVSEPNLKVEVENKKIVINGDFLNSIYSYKDLDDEINTALKNEKINQTVKADPGTMTSFKNINGSSDDSGVDDAIPTLTYTDSNGKVVNSVGGFTFTNFTNGELNDYKINIRESSKGTALSVSIEDGEISISGDFETGFTKQSLQTKLDNALRSAGIRTNIDVNGTSDLSQILNKLTITDGVTATAPKALNIAGLQVTLPTGSMFNNIEFEISDIHQSLLSAEIVGGNNGEPYKIQLKGDFTERINSRDLQDVINEAIDKHTTLKGEVKVASGKTERLTTKSDIVQGGERDRAPGKVEVGNMEIEFSEGSEFNNYKFILGTITPGTKTSIDINSSNKTIVINGDFVTSGAITSKNIQDALNRALENKGIEQSVEVSGRPIEIPGVVSDETSGGTPVESLIEDGSINFVDATKDLKSYDNTLKTLKIPDKVRIPGTDTELSIKTYTIDTNGIISGVLEDGRVAALGQIAMAAFKNSEGLNKLGGNLYSASVNSGNAIIKSGVGTLGDDNSQGYGDNLQGMVEMSNVDLSEQFTDMIVSNRAFQAAGKMITTGDEILQDIINLKR